MQGKGLNKLLRKAGDNHGEREASGAYSGNFMMCLCVHACSVRQRDVRVCVHACALACVHI